MEFKDYLTPLRRWWWLIVAATLVATVSSYLATRDRPLVYRTKATVMVGGSIENPVPNGDTYLAEQIANTYADIIRRKPIRVATMAALGLTSLPGYTSRQIPNTRLLEVTVTDTDPVRGQTVANELVNQLVRISSAGQGQDDQQQRFLAEELSDLQVGIRETKAEIAKQKEELAGMFSARQIADAQAQIAGLQNKLSALQDSYATLLSNTRQAAVNVVTVIEEAELPTSPIGTGTSSTILLAAVIGFALAAGAAYLLEYLDDTLKSPEDVERALKLSTLGSLVNLGGNQADARLVTALQPESPTAEAYRILRTNLQFSTLDTPLRTLAVVSSRPLEGKSTTVANLAVVMAQQGKRVIVVDADLHRPSQQRIFSLPNNTGLTSALLLDPPACEGLLRETVQKNLWVLPTGPLPPHPSEMLSSRRFAALMEDLKQQADVVLFDCPPVLAVSDAAILASQVDGVLFVVEAGATRRQHALRACEALHKVGARVLGAAINRIKAQDSHYYAYYNTAYGDQVTGGRHVRSRAGRLRLPLPSSPVRRSGTLGE